MIHLKTSLLRARISTKLVTVWDFHTISMILTGQIQYHRNVLLTPGLTVLCSALIAVGTGGTTKVVSDLLGVCYTNDMDGSPMKGVIRAFINVGDRLER